MVRILLSKWSVITVKLNSYESIKADFNSFEEINRYTK